MVSIQKKMAAEFFGTFWLVFGGCGSAVLAGNYINNTGVAFAFGLTVLTMAFALGHISGCHLNPAVSLGLLTAGRFDRRELGPYILSQVLGAAAGSLAIYLIASGIDSFSLAASGFACNGYGEHSPGRYNFLACAVSEIVLTFFFLLVIIGATDKRAPKGLAPVAIGLALALCHLIGIQVTNLSVNPARSTGPAIFHGGWAMAQLWFFWVMPAIGAVLAGLVYRGLFEEKR
ncbi:aquaporin Z [Victivallis sp. Marseille-Q1083]|uniref:aquaporin Z n=1 Tax=Victivallis sp. Marseille-Q1083 TaxID=2717288 RepID=UPI00158F3167|nr:aquaporin Z [Victivallis sp. Marseille-Q1083]